MAQRDAYICDVIVIPTDRAADNIDALSKELSAHGLDIRDVNRDQNVIEGTVDAGKVRALDDLEGVEYVRTVYSYIADYPAGDPRDASVA